MTLKDLFAVMWSITDIRITAREPEHGEFIHEWIFAEDIKENSHMYYDRISGKLTIVPVKVNLHSAQNTGWGVNEKVLPKELITAPITHLNVFNWYSGTYRIDADVEMQRLTAEVIVKNGETT